MLITSISSILAGKSHGPPPSRVRGGRVIVLLALAAAGTACGETDAAVEAPAGIHLERVSGWHHEGEDLSVSFTAESARLEPESDVARLERATVRLPAHATELAAPRVALDLRARRVHGTDGVRASGPGFEAEAEQFDLDARSERLTLRGEVRAMGSLAP